jgi:hypothetical protein
MAYAVMKGLVQRQRRQIADRVLGFDGCLWACGSCAVEFLSGGPGEQLA